MAAPRLPTDPYLRECYQRRLDHHLPVDPSIELPVAVQNQIARVHHLYRGNTLRKDLWLISCQLMKVLKFHLRSLPLRLQQRNYISKLTLTLLRRGMIPPPQ